MVDKRCSDYVLDQLEAERKFLLYAHHQEMLDAVEYAVRAKVNSFFYMSLILCWSFILLFLKFTKSADVMQCSYFCTPLPALGHI